MPKQLFLNNFTSTFIANVKDAATTGTPAIELGYGILQLNSGAATSLINPTGGDYYVLTAYKRSGSVESNVEIMKVTAVDNSVINECRITVLRAQDGTSAQAYVPGDYISLRFTKGGAENLVQRDSTETLTNKTLTNPVINGFTGGTGVINIGSGQFYKDTSGNVGVGTSSPQAKLVASNGGAAGLEFYTNYPGGGVGTYIQSYNRSGSAYISTAYDAATHSFRIGGIERVKVDINGNALVTGGGGLGYGTGSGGTVTQPTSKSTAVTLNKSSGQITMNAGALVAGASVFFQLNNSVLTTSDVLVINSVFGGLKYSIECTSVELGAVIIRVTNITAGALSEAVILNFTVIKGAVV